jgi:hypothetical protein
MRTSAIANRTVVIDDGTVRRVPDPFCDGDGDSTPPKRKRLVCRSGVWFIASFPRQRCDFERKTVLVPRKKAALYLR